jgi:hypothetical protein
LGQGTPIFTMNIVKSFRAHRLAVRNARATLKLYTKVLKYLPEMQAQVNAAGKTMTFEIGLDDFPPVPKDLKS